VPLLQIMGFLETKRYQGFKETGSVSTGSAAGTDYTCPKVTLLIRNVLDGGNHLCPVSSAGCISHKQGWLGYAQFPHPSKPGSAACVDVAAGVQCVHVCRTVIKVAAR
jgi:hypothetical protein